MYLVWVGGSSNITVSYSRTLAWRRSSAAAGVAGLNEWLTGPKDSELEFSGVCTKVRPHLPQGLWGGEVARVAVPCSLLAPLLLEAGPGRGAGSQSGSISSYPLPLE